MFLFKKEKKVICSPISGKVVPFEMLDDVVFKEGMMGPGIAVDPVEETFVAPVSGVVSLITPTKHAFIITSKEGIEVMVHIGMDTVYAQGEHFKYRVSQGDQIKQGQPILDIDLKAMKEKGYSLVTPIVLINKEKIKKFNLTQEQEILISQPLIYYQ
jgi:glucose-specific phosphotransferase system IIA component